MYFVAPQALQAFWAALAERLRRDPETGGCAIPDQLRQDTDCHIQWLEPDLLLSQACGYPLMTRLAGQVQLVGSLAYAVPGVDGIFCRSQLLCRADDSRQSLIDFAGSTLAYNDTHSQSGYNALRALVAGSTAQRPFFGDRFQSGGHYRSIDAICQGRADMAAVDAVSWALWQQDHAKQAGQLRVFGQTEPYPGLPLISSLQTPPRMLAALRRALQKVATDSAYAAVRAPLHISGFEATTLADYQTCIAMQEQAFALGLQAL